MSDLPAKRLTWRRLAVLIRHLPPESRTATDVLGADARWSETDHLLATVIDLLASANWQRGGAKAGPRPKPVERPGAKARGRRSRLTPAQMRTRLLAQQRREGNRGS